MRKFKKFYNRSMPIFSAQYWYKGERYGLGKIINDTDYYSPLFIYKKNKGVDVYYEVDKDDEDMLSAYFKNNPRHFELLARKYKQECNNLLNLVGTARPKDFSRVFNIHLSMWPKLSIMASLGNLNNRKKLKGIVKQAYKIRKSTEKVEYLSGNNLISLASQLFPDSGDFIYFLTYEEIRNKNFPSKKELLERKNGYIYFEDKLYANLALREFGKIMKIEFIKEKQPDNLKEKNILSGTIAMKGKARGRVRVIFEEYQLSKVKDGDILVAAMTTPDYIFAMKKASAFVTDEGGITCHAAITAREMKKPCIIGAKVATNILKNNDIAEVDANKGVVKILKRDRI